MSYFRFEIPLGPDGERIHYSPGWHGTMPKCPSGVKVLLYNDKEGFGIAETPDSVLPKEVTPLKEEDAKATLEAVKVEDGVYAGDKVLERIEWLPEAEVKEETTENEINPDIAETKVEQKAQFCPICHVFISYLPSNLTASKIIMTCPNGHRVVVNG